ncbi:MAG: hypothetical protein ABIQ44_10100, partial [Chloroflexia bacterium]
DLVQAIYREWPNAKIQYHNPPDPMLLDWEPASEISNMYCNFLPTHDAIGIEGASLEEVDHVAVWFRALVPSTYQLYLYEQGMNEVIELTPEVTKATILN